MKQEKKPVRSNVNNHILSVLASQILFLDKWIGTVAVYITRSGAVTAHWAAGSNLFGCVSVLACVLALAWMYQKERGGKGREELVPTREALWHVSSSFVQKLQCCFPFFTQAIWFEIQVLVQKEANESVKKLTEDHLFFPYAHNIFIFWFGSLFERIQRNLANVWTRALEQEHSINLRTYFKPICHGEYKREGWRCERACGYISVFVHNSSRHILLSPYTTLHSYLLSMY